MKNIIIKNVDLEKLSIQKLSLIDAIETYESLAKKMMIVKRFKPT